MQAFQAAAHCNSSPFLFLRTAAVSIRAQYPTWTHAWVGNPLPHLSLPDAALSLLCTCHSSLCNQSQSPTFGVIGFAGQIKCGHKSMDLCTRPVCAVQMLQIAIDYVQYWRPLTILFFTPVLCAQARLLSFSLTPSAYLEEGSFAFRLCEHLKPRFFNGRDSTLMCFHFYYFRKIHEDLHTCTSEPFLA